MLDILAMLSMLNIFALDISETEHPPVAFRCWSASAKRCGYTLRRLAPGPEGGAREIPVGWPMFAHITVDLAHQKHGCC